MSYISQQRPNVSFYDNCSQSIVQKDKGYQPWAIYDYYFISYEGKQQYERSKKILGYLTSPGQILPTEAALANCICQNTDSGITVFNIDGKCVKIMCWDNSRYMLPVYNYIKNDDTDSEKNINMILTKDEVDKIKQQIEKGLKISVPKLERFDYLDDFVISLNLYDKKV